MAIVECNRNRAFWPDVADLLAADANRELGRYPEALRLYEQAQKPGQLPYYGYAITLARMGRAKEARDVLTEYTAYAREHYVNPIVVAYIQANLGENDRAFESIERAVAERTAFVLAIPIMPEFDPIRSDPRYEALIKRIGLTEVKPR
jgi:tetratricopeptide (TPR) repeat protein